MFHVKPDDNGVPLEPLLRPPPGPLDSASGGMPNERRKEDNRVHGLLQSPPDAAREGQCAQRTGHQCQADEVGLEVEWTLNAEQCFT